MARLGGTKISTQNFLPRRTMLLRVAVCVLLLNILLASVLGMSLLDARKHYLSNALASVENQSLVFERDFSSSIDRIDLVLQLLAERVGDSALAAKDGTHLANDRQITEILIRERRWLPEILGLRVADAQGRITLSSDEPLTGPVSIADRPRFATLRDHPESGLVVEGPIQGRLSGKQVLILSRRINGPGGSFAGEVHATLALDKIGASFASLALGDSGNVGLWGPQGLFYVRYTRLRGIEIGGNVQASTKLRSLIDSTETQALYHTVAPADGIERDFAFRKVPGRPFYLVLGISTDEALQPWRQEALRDLVVGLLLLLVTGSAGAVIYVGWAQRRDAAIAFEHRQAEAITQVEQAHAEAEEARLRSESILTSAGEGICGIDLLGNVTFINQSARRMLGWEDDEGIGWNLHDKVHHHYPNGELYPAERCPTFSMLQLPASEVRPIRIEGEMFFRKDGTAFPVEFTSAPMIENGQLTGVVTLFRDIGDRLQSEQRRKAAETDLRASVARLKLVLETAAEGIIGLDDEGRVVFANKAAAEALAWPRPEDMLGRRSHDVFGHHLADGRDCTDGDCAMRATLQDGQIRRVDDETFLGNGKLPIPVDYAVSPLKVEEVIVGAVVIFHDVRDRKEMEADLKRSNAELEQFAYVASHDLRQPLRMITSYLGLIERQLKEHFDEDTQSFFDFAMGGARRLDRLILDLLEYSRVGRMSPGLTPLPLGEIVSDALFNLGAAIAEAGAEISVQDGLPQIQGDRSELTRLFQNIIGNAVKYRRPDIACRVEVSQDMLGHDWLIRIQDNGIGIDPRDHERAFGVFQRLVAKEQYEGTGIGLAICKKIVEHHGGRIWIESEPGQGSAFCFTLPRSNPA